MCVIATFLPRCSYSLFRLQERSEGAGTTRNRLKAEQASESGTESEDSAEYATLHPAYAEVNSPEEEINCWGDSITEGYGGDELTYPEVLEQLTGIPVRNLGVGGEDSREIMRRSLAYGSQWRISLSYRWGTTADGKTWMS